MAKIEKDRRKRIKAQVSAPAAVPQTRRRLRDTKAANSGNTRPCAAGCEGGCSGKHGAPRRFSEMQLLRKLRVPNRHCLILLNRI